MKLWDQKTPLVVLMAAIALIVAFTILRNNSSQTNQIQPVVSQNQQSISQTQFATPIKSAHFESNTPEHGAILAGVPINVVINFNFDLAKPSEIKIESSGKEYGLDETIIDTNKQTMRRKLDPNSPAGIYTVNYKACWADGSCHDGKFQFEINDALKSEFTDMTEQKEVSINMQNTSFSPAKIRISKGTKVTWINLDNTTHTVNTDSHPAHTYYLGQNSRDLSKGVTYSVTFSEPGTYLYHCTPHADTMHGQILVE